MKKYVETTAPGASAIRLAASASSTAESRVSSSRPAMAASTSNSNSLPSTAAWARAVLAASERRDRRRPITSRTPSGISRSRTPGVTQRPSRTAMPPDSARWRRISRMKNGFPAVAWERFSERATASGVRSRPARCSRRVVTSKGVNPRSAIRSWSPSWRSVISRSVRGCVRLSSPSR